MRESTKQLRRRYEKKLKKRSQGAAQKDSGQATPHEVNMADAQPTAPVVPTNDPPASGDDQEEIGDAGGQPDPRNGSRSGSQDSTKERLKNIEEMLTDIRNERRSRSKSKAQTPRIEPPKEKADDRVEPATRPKSPRRRTRSRSRYARRRSSSRRSHRSHRSNGRDRSTSRRRRRSSRSTTRRRSGSRTRRRSRSHRWTRSRSSRRYRRHRTRSASSRSTQSRSRTRSPRRHRRHTPRSSVEKALDEQYTRIGSHTGKRLPRSRATIEPYNNLPPDIREKARARSSRRALTYPEHMCGMLQMIMKTVDNKTETYSALRHLAHISQDAVTLMWPGVREWTQACLTHIQDGDVTWTDHKLFDEERTRISWIRGKPKQEIRIPCHEFNADKCEHKTHHTAEAITHRHVCAVCMYGTGVEKSSHNAKTCWKKTGLKTIPDEQGAERKHSRRFSQGKRDARLDNKPKNSRRVVVRQNAPSATRPTTNRASTTTLAQLITEQLTQ